MSVHAGPDISENGLVLCLDAGNAKSYAGSGTTWTDLSGNGNNGTLVNGVGFTVDEGGSLIFDGTNDYVESGIIEPTYLTLSCTFKATGAPSLDDVAGGGLIVANNQLFGGAIQYFFSYSWLNQNICFIFQGNTERLLTPTNSVLQNTIYKVDAVYDGNTKKIYVNGQLSISEPWTANPVYPTTGNKNVQIGRWGYGGYGRNFKGNIYQASIYNRALTAAEIKQNFNALRGRYGI